MEQEKYKEFRGDVVKEIPKLIAENRTIMSCDKLMQLRLDYKETGRYTDESYVTGDAIIFHPDRKIKIIYDSEHIKELCPREKYPYYGLHQKGLVLDEKIYKKLQGAEFLMKDLEKIMYEFLSTKEAKSSPFWQCLARDNQSLLDDYVDYVFFRGLEVDTSHWLYGDKKTKETYRAMGINYLLPSHEIEEVNHPILRACEICIFGLGSNFVSNNLWGEGSLIGISKDENENKEEYEKPKIPDDIDLPGNTDTSGDLHSRSNPSNRFSSLISHTLSYSYN